MTTRCVQAGVEAVLQQHFELVLRVSRPNAVSSRRKKTPKLRGRLLDSAGIR